MKKIIFIFCSLLMLGIGMNSFAQDATLNYSETYMIYTGKTADTIGVSDSLWSFELYKKTDARMYPVVEIELDSLSGTPNEVYVILSSKPFITSSYAVIDTISFYGSQSDTTIIFEPTGPYRDHWWNVDVKSVLDEFKVGIGYLNFLLLK